MKNLTKIALLGLTTLAMVGCNSSSTDCDTSGSIKSLDRTVSFLTDRDGMSLYIFDKDELNKSNCDAECQKIWPRFRGADTTNENITVVNGSDQLAYRKHPLYYFANDTIAGDVNGDNIKDVWHLIYAPAGSTDSQTALSTVTMKQTYLTDKDGRTLYTFDKDVKGTSNCYGECEDTWPIYYNPSVTTVPSGLNKSEFSTITRDSDRAKENRLKQTTYNGQPLYYFTPDAKKSGSTKGDWVKGLWDVVELNAEKVN